MDNRLIVFTINLRITKLYNYRKYEDIEYTIIINKTSNFGIE